MEEATAESAEGEAPLDLGLTKKKKKKKTKVTAAQLLSQLLLCSKEILIQSKFADRPGRMMTLGKSLPQ